MKKAFKVSFSPLLIKTKKKKKPKKQQQKTKITAYKEKLSIASMTTLQV